MDLEDFLTSNKIVKAQFSKKSKISYQYLQKILKGRAKPSKEIAKRIEEASGNKVSVEEILSAPLIKPPEKVNINSTETENINNYQQKSENKMKDLYDRMMLIETVLEKIAPTSQLTRYHLDFIQQIMEREKDGLTMIEVLKSYKENINKLIEDEGKKVKNA